VTELPEVGPDAALASTMKSLRQERFAQALPRFREQLERAHVKSIVLVLVVCLIAATTEADASIVFNEGEFSTWTFSYFGSGGGTATMVREDAGGNPGARARVTTEPSVLRIDVYGSGIKNDYSTAVALNGTTFTLMLDVLSGAGAFGAGHAINILVEQGGTVYSRGLGFTFLLPTFTTLSFTNTFDPASFTRVSGVGPPNPDFAGGVTTRFGFAAGAFGPGASIQYYDNIRLDLAAVPAAAHSTLDVPTLSTWALIALAIVVAVRGSSALRDRRR